MLKRINKTNKNIGGGRIGGVADGVLPQDIATVAQVAVVAASVTALLTSATISALTVDTITENTVGKGIVQLKNVVRKNTYAALNLTGTITAAMVNNGGITSTSAAGVTATLDTAVAIAAQIGAVQGTTVEFYVDNTAGANTVTVAVGAGIVAAAPVITGGATLTVAASATQGIGIYRLVFSSATAAVLFRIG